ncbi:MAG: insulinase family protein, partial [Deltaproteobacteria bacterium]|nr:insulinase family protein [Deltaproteobacteria bacterium]
MLTSRLDNGMHVALWPDLPGTSADVAAVYAWIDVGAADEPRGLEGAAHFIEHLVFKGTRSFGVGEVAAAVEALGGDINAWTAQEETVFHATVPGAAAPRAVEILAEMVREPRFDAKELERERDVVIEEIRGGEDDVDLVVSEATWAVAFPGHPYGRSVIGTPSSVGAMSRRSLLDFHRRYYMPANTHLVVAGQFDAEAVLAAVTAAFAGGPARPPRARARPRGVP